MPACKKTPADAAAKANQTKARCASAAPWLIIDFDMKPDVKGKDEIARAPMIPIAAVNGILLNRPPRSVHFRRPSVISNTDPADINSRAL